MEETLKEIREFVEHYELEVSEKAILRADKMVNDGHVDDIEEAVYRMMSWGFDASDPVNLCSEIAAAVDFIGEDFELEFIGCDDCYLMYNVKEK